ncbi:MAG: CPBP family intramembrane metalloprotease [Clostridia bacterium]|nr:CPBP family intramembrane metalloprotease [Clostridia bacterium]
MKNALKLLTLLCIAFILLNSAAGSFGGALRVVLQCFAFALPVVIGYVASRRFKREREEIAGVAESESTLFELSRSSLREFLPTVAPTVAVIFLLSYLTSLLLGALGMTGNTVEDAPLYEMILLHALIPSVLEEMLFRYLPMKLLAPYSRRACVIISSLYFAVVHMSLYQLPYAFAAGLIFIIIDLACESVLPSVILHFINNTVSVLFIKYGENPDFALWFVIIMVALALVSLIPIIIRRKEYIESVRRALLKGEGIGELFAPGVFTVMCVLLSILNTLTFGGANG